MNPYVIRRAPEAQWRRLPVESLGAWEIGPASGCVQRVALVALDTTLR